MCCEACRAAVNARPESRLRTLERSLSCQAYQIYTLFTCSSEYRGTKSGNTTSSECVGSVQTHLYVYMRMYLGINLYKLTQKPKLTCN